MCLGNNRNNGSSLGSFYVNANNGLADSGGNTWRARPFLLETSSTLPLWD